MNLIDTHAHLTFEGLAGDVEGVLRRSVEAGVSSWVTVGTEPGELEKVAELIPRYRNLYGALGYHPHHAGELDAGHIETLERLLAGEKIVAVGETGLDYYYEHSEREAQRRIFRRHLEIAAGTGLPVIVHSREALEESLAILDEFAGRLKRVVIHCWGGSPEETRRVLEKGYYLSFTGIVTFKRSEMVRESAALVPLERLMVETDCPFISPEPVRNVRPCEPALMVYTARKISEVKGLPFEVFAEAVTRTSREFFELPEEAVVV